MPEWTNDSFPVGTHVRMTSENSVLTGTVVPPNEDNVWGAGRLWIMPDDTPDVRKVYSQIHAMHGWSSYEIEEIKPADPSFRFFVTAARAFKRIFDDQDEAVTFARGMRIALDQIATNHEYEAGSVMVTKVYNGPAPERIYF